VSRILLFLKNMSLYRRFMLASLIILLAGMLGIGAWVQQQIVDGVIHRTGATTALYVDSFVAPQIQGVNQTAELTQAQRDALSRLLRDTPMGKQIVMIKIWDPRGRLLYSTDASAIGKLFPMHEGMLRARLGEVDSEISQLDEEENMDLGAVYPQLLETYSPIWQSGTDQVIAVAEFYQKTDDLKQELAVLTRRSWLVVGLAILLIYLLLAGFVRGASRTIQGQQKELASQVVQLTGLLAQNRELNERVRRASASVAQLNEGYLKRIGSELHDGPAQELGLSILKLDALAGNLEKSTPGADLARQLEEIGLSMQNALKEMRAIAAGLSLPQLANLDLAGTVQHAVRAHERRTGTRVELDLQPLSQAVGLPLRITIYRLIQEALSNACRHAGGAGQRVQLAGEDGQLTVTIADSGPGFDPLQAASSGRLGLSGMRERVESLGGSFQVESRPGHGTTIQARLPLLNDGGTARE